MSYCNLIHFNSVVGVIAALSFDCRFLADRFVEGTCPLCNYEVCVILLKEAEKPVQSINA